MKLLRTPDERFADLPGFPFEPRYCEVPTGYGDLQLRIHYIDEGPREAPVVVLLHGEPVWSYLWRKLVPEVARAGFRVVALDLPGFGRSDKPAAAELFSLSEVTHWMRMAIVLRLELDRMTCIGQGLGALVGLSLATVHWRALGRVLVIGPPVDLRPPGGAEPGAFSAESYAESLQRESAGQFVQRHTVTELAPEVVRAYDAPFPDSGLRAGLGASMRRGTTAGDPLAN
ncbi:MAG: alpha/beta fold hydrolase [Thermoanaerobaculia bacterium]|nr:alpha/beta fold hydrolase [Thermoanaerobaculia bacterium]